MKFIVFFIYILNYNKYISHLLINKNHVKEKQIINLSNKKFHLLLDNLNNNNNNNNENENYEIDFLLNKKIKVYIHLEQLFSKTNIYHIGITFKSIKKSIRYDIHGINLSNTNLYSKNGITKTIFWDYSNKTLEEIENFEQSLNYRYFLGVYDCRHYVRELTSWSTGKSSPLWKLHRLVKKN
jgi:hypothetical protein